MTISRVQVWLCGAISAIIFVFGLLLIDSGSVSGTFLAIAWLSVVLCVIGDAILYGLSRLRREQAAQTEIFKSLRSKGQRRDQGADASKLSKTS